MTDRKTRGKQSKIDLLPKPIKTKLDELLRDNKTSQKSILEVVNLLIENAGLSEDKKLSTSGINRYSSKMETIGHDIRQAREMAEIWVAKLGDQPTGDVSQLLMEMLRTQSFRLLVKANENPDDVLDPKTIGELALGIQRIEKAAMLNMDKEKEIKKAFAAAAAEQIDEAAVQVGLTAEGAELIKQKILGIT
jgi:phage gp37-like protein